LREQVTFMCVEETLLFMYLCQRIVSACYLELPDTTRQWGFKGGWNAVNYHCCELPLPKYRNLSFRGYVTMILRAGSHQLGYFYHWAPPYYAQATFGLTSSYLLNVIVPFLSDWPNQQTFVHENKRIWRHITYGRYYIHHEISSICIRS